MLVIIKKRSLLHVFTRLLTLNYLILQLTKKTVNNIKIQFKLCESKVKKK